METKPGYKTTEFYLALIAVALGAVVASGILPIEGMGAKVVGIVEAGLVALGYTGARLTLKKMNP